MKMKKSISLLCCVIIASMGIILTGCGNSSNNKDSENSGEKYADSPYVGTWEAKVAEYEGVKYDAEEAIGGAALMIDEDGTAIYFGGGTRIDDKWEPTEDGLKLWKEGENEQTFFIYKDDMLIVDVETEGELMTLYFEREDDNDKDAESSNDKDAESSNDKDTESNSDKDTENSSEKYADSPYVGAWVAKVVENKGIEYDAEAVIGVSKFTFNADGTGTYITDDMKEEIEWEPTEDGAKFADDSGVDYFTYKDGNLLLNLETEEVSLTVHYEKLK